MRVFWSVVLTGGLLLVGLDVFQSQTRGGVTSASTEDGTGLPPNNPPPPPPR